METAGQILRDLRIERGLTLQAVGKAIGRSRGTVSKWELGKVTPPADVLGHLLSHLNVPPETVGAVMARLGVKSAQSQVAESEHLATQAVADV